MNSVKIELNCRTPTGVGELLVGAVGKDHPPSTHELKLVIRTLEFNSVIFSGICSNMCKLE